MKQLLLLVALCFCSTLATAQDQENSISEEIDKKVYFTKPMSGTLPTIDGKLEEACWETVEWGTNFIQREPYEGEKATRETAFKILYDAKNLYVAFRCYDEDPSKIERRLSRRDGFAGDWVEINIDSYHDLRSAFSFTITAAGVKGDEFISNNGGNWDSSWDPIWYVKTQVDDLGWTAEARIPLSQLRFADTENHIWGLQVNRRDFREEERSHWQFVKRNNALWVASFGELHGITGIKPQKQLEIQPYVVAQAESFEREEGNPFATGDAQKLTVGLDGKIGVTSDLTVDFTINPDFGQVEADPAALTLDGYEIFFSERRPFFIEGRNIFDYRVTSSEAGGPFNNDLLFYSRRIGGAPHRYPDLGNEEYANVPSSTSILGAAKFTGKTKKGLSIGVMESITQREMAEIDNNGERREEEVEPLSNYFVGRLQQDFREGGTVIGGMFTAVNRDVKDSELDFLHGSAYTGGIDFLHRWNKQMWYVSANTVFSKVNGTPDAITRTQESFTRLFQREGADHLSVDTSLTSLSGYGGTLRLGRVGGGKKFNFDTGVTWRSPGLDLNDVGFLRASDDIVHFIWAGYRWDKPFSIFRNARVSYNHWAAWDFGGLNTFRGFNVNGHAQFKNNSGIGTGFNINPYDISTKNLRGGPAIRFSPSMNNWTYYSTDSRKKVNLNFNVFHSWSFDKSSLNQNYSLWANYQPMRTLRVSIGPELNIRRNDLQFVDNLDFDGTTRYVNATINQKTLSMSVRINYTIRPNLTLQYYGQPFISRGRYSNFKYISDPLAVRAENRYIALTDEQITYDEAEELFLVNEDLDDKIDYEINDPDFNFIQFRSNLVARWEYIPGSELFLVWSQGTTSFGNPGDRLLPSLSDNLFGEKAHNIFLIKYTYRFIR